MLRWSFAFLVGGSLALYFDSLVRFTEVNFFLSDTLFILSGFCLLLHPSGMRALLRGVRRNDMKIPFAIFAAAAVLQAMGSPAPERTLAALAQLAFVFWVLGTLVCVHSERVRYAVRLWWPHWIMIPLAGLVSVGARLGLAEVGDATYYRYANPLLGVNGFWLFGLVCPFLLDRMVRRWLAGRWVAGVMYGCLCTLGFTGVVLSGVRAGLVLTALSILWLVWFYRPFVVRGRALVFAGRRVWALIAVFVAVGAGFVSENYFGVFRQRALEERIGSASTLMARIEIARIAVEEIPERLLWGAGVNQFMIRHPELPDVIHNYYLQAAYEAGAAGFLGLLWIFWRLFRSARRFARWAQLTRLREVTAQAEACVFVVLAMALAGMVYPLPHGRLEWLLVLLAWGPGRSRPSGFLGDKLRG